MRVKDLHWIKKVTAARPDAGELRYTVSDVTDEFAIIGQ